MALATADLLATFDQSTTEKLDLSDVLAAILLTDTFLMGAISTGAPATQTTHTWPEAQLNATTVTQLAGETALTGSATSLVVASAQGLRVRIGALLRDIAADKEELIQVTDIATDTLTIVRGFGATSGETHAAAAEFLIVGMPVQEGDTGVTDRARARTKGTNYTQIFKREVIISGSTEAVEQAGVPDEFRYQMEQRMLELQRELGIAIWNSYSAASVGSDTVYRSMSGVKELITASGGNTNTTAESLSESVVNTMYKAAWDDGGNPTAIWGARQQIGQFATFDQDKIRVAPSDRSRGKFVSKFLTDLGAEIDVRTDRWIGRSEVGMLDMSRISLHPLKGRAFFMEPLSKTGDARRAQILGEYTLEVRNATLAHAVHTGLTVPS